MSLKKNWCTDWTIRGDKFPASFSWIYCRLGIPWNKGKILPGPSTLHPTIIFRKNLVYLHCDRVLEDRVIHFHCLLWWWKEGAYATWYQLTALAKRHMSQGWLWRVCSTSQLWWGQVKKRGPKRNTLQGTNISHLWKRKTIIKSVLGWDMLVPRRVFLGTHWIKL